MTQAIKARLYLTLAMVLAGSSVVFSKLVAASVPTFLANILILGPAALVLLALTRLREGQWRWPAGQWRPLLLQALFGVVLFRVFLFYGLPLTSAASGGILSSGVPAVTALLAWAILRERLSPRTLAGVLLTGLGMLTMTVPGAATSAGRDPLLGNLLVLGAVFGEASWNVLSRLSGARLSPLAATTYVTVLAFLMFLPLGLPQALTFSFDQLPPALWWALLYYALGATVLAYLCWFAGVRHVSASTAAVYTGWFPVSAVACSALFLHEHLTVWHGLGLLLVLLATFVLARQDDLTP